LKSPTVFVTFALFIIIDRIVVCTRSSKRQFVSTNFDYIEVYCILFIISGSKLDKETTAILIMKKCT